MCRDSLESEITLKQEYHKCYSRASHDGPSLWYKKNEQPAVGTIKPLLAPTGGQLFTIDLMLGR
jgi:hypothetical protein